MDEFIKNDMIYDCPKIIINIAKITVSFLIESVSTFKHVIDINQTLVSIESSSEFILNILNIGCELKVIQY